METAFQDQVGLVPNGQEVPSGQRSSSNQAPRPVREEPLLSEPETSGGEEGRYLHGFSRTLDSDPGGRYSLLRESIQAVRDTEDRPEGAPYAPYVSAPEKGLKAVLSWRERLEDHDGFRMLAQYLLHSDCIADEGGLIADWKTIFRQFGLKTYRSGNHYNARTLLWGYKLLVDKDLTWSPPHSNERARTIDETGIPQRVKDLQSSPPGEDVERVQFMTGNKDTRTNRKRHQSGGPSDEKEPIVEPPPDAERLKSYLNGRSTELFLSLSEQASEVRAAILSGQISLESGSKREQVRKSLRRIEDHPKPRYAHSEKSPRLRSSGENRLVGLDSFIRKGLYASRHIELDLSKAHAAIAARDWGGLDMLEDSLHKHITDPNYDFWNSLGSSILIGLPTPPGEDQDAARTAVKRGLYTLVYGGSKNTIRFNLAETYGDELGIDAPSHDAVKSFLGYPLVREMLEARDKKLSQINEEGGLVDCYGRPIRTEDLSEHPNCDNPARTALAYCAQARELFLLRPIVDLARKEEKAVERGEKERPAFQILLYQYDGVTIHVTYKSQRETVTRRLQKAVDEHAKKHGYLTALEVDWKPSDMTLTRRDRPACPPGRSASRSRQFNQPASRESL